jgi:hypothetical protein
MPPGYAKIVPVPNIILRVPAINDTIVAPRGPNIIPLKTFTKCCPGKALDGPQVIQSGDKAKVKAAKIDARATIFIRFI